MRKKLLLLFASFLLTGGQARGQDIIHDLIGDVEVLPISLDMDYLHDVVNVNGTLHVIGRTGGLQGIDHLQTVDLATGFTSGLQTFIPQTGNQNPTWSEVGLSSVTKLADGRVLYVGGSNNSLGHNPTYWFDPSTPISATQPQNAHHEGFVKSATREGVFVGASSVELASYGDLQDGFRALPSPPFVSVALDITGDGRFIGGSSAIWHRNATGEYEFLDTSGFDVPPDSFGSDNSWEAVAIDPVTGNAVFGSYYTNSTTFDQHFGLWAEDGSFLFGGLAGETFNDFEVYEGQLVMALNGINDTGLYAITDQSRLELAEIFGTETRLGHFGLFEGSVGFLVDGSNGTFVTTYSSNAVPEPGAVVILAFIGCLGAVRRRRV